MIFLLLFILGKLFFVDCLLECGRTFRNLSRFDYIVGFYEDKLFDCEQET